MKNTLKNAAEFRAARRGRYIKTDYFTLVASKGEAGRYGLVTSARVGNAVQRNRLRRITRTVLSEANLGKTVLVMFHPAAGAYYTDGQHDLAADLRAAIAKV